MAISGILAAGGVGVALGFKDKIREVWRDLVEWKDKGLGAGRPKDLLVVGGSGLAALGVTALALSFLGGFGGLATLGGGSGAIGSPAAASASYGPPNTPTAAAVMISDTSGYVIASAFAGTSDDSVDYTIFEIDSLRGDFATAPLLVDTQTYAAGHVLRSDTIFTFTASDTFKARTRHFGMASNQLSSYSVVDTFVASSNTLSWFCDWDHATGTSSAATRGTASTGSGLTECFGTESVLPDTALLETITNPGTLGFPASMTNLLRISLSDTLYRSQLVEITNGWDTIPVGGAMFLRSYDRLDLAVGQSTNTHVLHIGDKDASPNYVYWHVQSNSTVRSDSTYDLDAEVRVGTPSKWRDKNATAGPAFEVIRREVQFYRPHADTLVINVQTFDSTGSALAVPADYWCQVCSGTFHVDLLKDQRFHMSNASLWDVMRSMEMGNNGAEANDPTLAYWYWGGMAVRVTTDTSAWIGAYPVGVEGN